MFPITCVDNFYSNPDQIRDFALSLKYSKIEGIYPGERTEPLFEIDNKFNVQFTLKVLSLFYNYRHEDVNFRVISFFQKIYPFSENVKDLLNNGWFHSDSDCTLAAGVIYLTPSPNPDSGTMFGAFIDDSPEIDYNLSTDMRHNLYKNNNLDDIDIESYRKQISIHNNSFQETLEVKNQYNRLICYDSKIFHRENNFFCNPNEPRLTQVFFIKELNTENPPLNRMHNYEVQTPRLSQRRS